MRPLSITTLCIILFGIGISLFIRSISQLFLFPSVYTFVMLAISLSGLYCYYGLWNMKTWSIPLFYAIWTIIPLPILMGFEGHSVTTIIRVTYFGVLLIVFSIIVLPHKGKFIKSSLWDYKS
ncbi:MAG: hypothetical protein methR_P3066 [Methyloprofundus sp.]|nr:MAG: hypothetical protein methR_P3066 [Methyloprofundus sp.]